MDITPAIGVGVSDLHWAARAEVERIVGQAKGDVVEQSKLLIGMLRDRELITETEVAILTELAEIDYEVEVGKATAQQGYFDTRRLYNSLLADPATSPFAHTVASSAVGTYTITQGSDGSGAVVFARSDGHWKSEGTYVGGILGYAIGGPAGALVGGAVGGLVGDIADHCTK